MTEDRYAILIFCKPRWILVHLIRWTKKYSALANKVCTADDMMYQILNYDGKLLLQRSLQMYVTYIKNFPMYELRTKTYEEKMCRILGSTIL